jgi:hypothetical protein
MKSLLFSLISLVALTSTLTGILLMSIPDGSIFNLPISFLKDSSFKDYFFPGLFLAIILGGTSLLAVYFNMIRHAKRYNWAIASGLTLCFWMLFQFSLFHGIWWFDFILFLIGILIVLIAYQLKGKMLI